ncbi:ABC transporter substrate-binding protein [Paenibacillaceae bacterium WGS1546]|uniref:ABC transporter substrate-binding protein n=1 Tax=Cohnella sp. WGS1546 TaxID=3366810 RepID=UPI00372CFA5E
MFNPYAKNSNRTKSMLTALLSVIVALTVILAGCSGKNESAPSSASPSGTAAASPSAEPPAEEAKVEEGAVLKIWGSKSALEKAAAGFEQKFGVKVEIEEIGLKDAELKQFMLSKVTAKQTADLTALDLDYIPFYDKGVLMPLNELIERDGIKQWPWLNKDIFEHLPYNGNIYYLPSGSAVYGLWYNVNLAKELGIEEMLPKSFDDPLYETWTWDKYVEVLKKATVDTDGDGKIDIYGTDDNWGWGRTDWAATVGVYNNLIENGRVMADNLNYASPEAIEAIQFMNDLALKHQVAPPADLDTKAAGINIENEKVVVRRMGSWAFGYFKDNANPEREKAGKKPIEYSFTMYPHKAGMKDAFKVHGFSAPGPRIFANTKYPKAAWEFIKYYHSPEFESENYNIFSGGNLPKFSDTNGFNLLKDQVGEQTAKILVQLGEHLIEEGKQPSQTVPTEYQKQYPAGQKPIDQLNAMIPDIRKGKINFGDIIGPLYEQQVKDTIEAWAKYDADQK